MNEKILIPLESLPFFTKRALMVMEPVGEKTLSENIQRWVKKGTVVRLKNGLYVTKTHVDRFFSDGRYVELVANKLVIPSYLSLDYVLQKHGLLTEATYSITSVTTKSTRQYANKLGFFSYFSIHPDLYFGFEKKGFGKQTVFEAKISKALFDYFYLRLPGLPPGNKSVLEELRINWGNVSPENFRDFCSLLKWKKNMAKTIPLLEEIYEQTH